MISIILFRNEGINSQNDEDHWYLIFLFRKIKHILTRDLRILSKERKRERKKVRKKHEHTGTKDNDDKVTRIVS